MKIRLKEAVEAKFITNVCCFSGMCQRETRTLVPGEILEVTEVPLGPFKKPKIKTRPGQEPWRYVHTLVLDNDRRTTLHPDTVSGLPEGTFEVIE